MNTNAMFLSLISFNVFQITTFHYFVEYGKGLTLCFIKHLDTFDIRNKNQSTDSTEGQEIEYTKQHMRSILIDTNR